MKQRLNALTGSIRGFFASIRFRLTLWSVVVLAVILLVFSVFVYLRQVDGLRVYTQSRLEFATQQIVSLLRYAGVFDPEGSHISPADLNQRVDMLLNDQTGMALIGPNSQTLMKTGSIDPAAIQQGITTFQSASQDGRAISFLSDLTLPEESKQKFRSLVLVTPLIADHQTIGLILLTRPIDPDGQLPRLIFTLGLSSLAVLALVLMGGYWLAGRAMAPVRTITRAARGISETDLHQRLHLGTRDELGELADTFDAMLDRLQAAFDRQRQFTADASHELRTPLTIVSLEADHALARRRSGDEYERALLVIKSENEYMTHLVSDLLTLARMDAGQTQLKLEPLDLSYVTLEVVERLSPLARRDHVALVTGDLPEAPIQGDRQFLSQMVSNLVENAIKYSGGAGHHVWIDTGCAVGKIDAGSAPATRPAADGPEKNSSAGDRPYVWLKVADDGPGIPAEDLPHLFDRFYRVDKARSRQAGTALEDEPEKTAEGSGLGLSIVQWIANAHQGYVRVESSPGQGAVFEVRLPGDRAL